MVASTACGSAGMTRSGAPTTNTILPEIVNATSPEPGPSPKEVVETFTNDTKIGRPGRNKIEIEMIGSKEETSREVVKTARIKFYSLTPAKQWELKQTLEIEDYTSMGAQPQIADFNNDGLRDITFISGTAARGANEIRTLLIYDKHADTLIYIKNSADYPNLEYNKALNCITSWMFSGTTSTVFLKLHGDVLKEFASVTTGPELVVEVIAKDGKRREIRREKMSQEDLFTRYETFDPPR